MPPTLSPAIGPARRAAHGRVRVIGMAVLALVCAVGAAHAQARRCGPASFAAAKPLSWAPELGDAALMHSRDMARQNYFRHRANDGSRVADRVERQGYAWRQVGENIAAGQGSAQQAVSAWLSSPPHCANLMNPNHAQMGAAYAVDADSDSTIYWTQVFATPR